jgi:hypothetical protein
MRLPTCCGLFTAAFDFDGQMMYLTANERHSEPHRFDATGLGFIRRGGRHVVFQVLPRSAGAVAGVVAGDALLEIGGRPASALTPIEVRDLLAPMEPGVEP